MKLTVQAHAKINWSLNILARRDDGYHELDMLMQPIELADELVFEDSRWLTLSVDGASLPTNDRNLVLRAANALNDVLGTRYGARIRLKKRIPSRAGLGGGSADCAAALLTLNRMWGLNLPMSTLMQIGAKLGADVPFCLQGGLVRVGGFGERLHPLPGAPSIPLAMVTPGGGLSTPGVFREWDDGGDEVVSMDVLALADALRQGDLNRAQALSFNALEAPAIRMMPKIREVMQTFRSLGARMVRMTGSGSTVFAAFDSDEAACRAAAQVPEAIATRTIGD